MWAGGQDKICSFYGTIPTILYKLNLEHVFPKLYFDHLKQNRYLTCLTYSEYPAYIFLSNKTLTIFPNYIAFM